MGILVIINRQQYPHYENVIYALYNYHPILRSFFFRQLIKFIKLKKIKEIKKIKTLSKNT